jgi:histidine triad (HIT) family protein
VPATISQVALAWVIQNYGDIVVAIPRVQTTPRRGSRQRTEAIAVRRGAAPAERPVISGHRLSRYRGGMSCVFCAIVAGEAPAIRIYEDDDYLAILDVRPFTRGHTLIIPKRHTVDLTDTPPDTVAAMVTIGQRIARAARQSGLHADGNNVVINDGKAAFQSVLHIHLHVLPRQSGDKLSFAKGMLLRRDPDREESGRLLREALAQLDSATQD